ncbi:MAG: hypothetical protein KC609_18525 [Myxococcales bacterium]|nr:hypothetical protein [Myxococcales bacterium]
MRAAILLLSMLLLLSGGCLPAPKSVRSDAGASDMSSSDDASLDGSGDLASCTTMTVTGTLQPTQETLTLSTQVALGDTKNLLSAPCLSLLYSGGWYDNTTLPTVQPEQFDKVCFAKRVLPEGRRFDFEGVEPAGIDETLALLVFDGDVSTSLHAPIFTLVGDFELRPDDCGTISGIYAYVLKKSLFEAPIESKPRRDLVDSLPGTVVAGAVDDTLSQIGLSMIWIYTRSPTSGGLELASNLNLSVQSTLPDSELAAYPVLNADSLELGEKNTPSPTGIFVLPSIQKTYDLGPGPVDLKIAQNLFGRGYFISGPAGTRVSCEQWAGSRPPAIVMSVFIVDVDTSTGSPVLKTVEPSSCPK